MGINIGMFEFDGPELEKSELKNEPGIYALLHKMDESYELIALDQCASLREWSKKLDLNSMGKTFQGLLSLAVHYTPRLSLPSREFVVNEIMQEFEKQPWEFSLQVVG